MGNKSSSENGDGSVEDATGQTEQQMSYYQMAKMGYQQLVNAIIRPPRCEYDTDMLGPESFTFCEKRFERVDFTIRNSRNMKICCSMWEPCAAQRPHRIMPCVVYMHGNSSGRVEALSQLSLVLSLGATLLSFDFCGSGWSDGDYVSLGVYERDDLQAVIEHLRMLDTVSTIALWGRSMGAATALLHGDRDPTIAGMVLDSAFSDLTVLAEEMVEKGRQQGMYAPGFVVWTVISFIRSSIQKTANFNIKDVSPIRNADRCYIPAMFVAGSGDDFVPPSHSEKIHGIYAGDKSINIVPGDHNSARPQMLLEAVSYFLAATLQLPAHWKVLHSEKYYGQVPWHLASMGREGYLTEEDISLEDILAMSAAQNRTSSRDSREVHVHRNDKNAVSGGGMSVDQVDVGMTDERQKDIRNAIFNMFGAAGADTNTPCASTTQPQSSRNSSAGMESIEIPGGAVDDSVFYDVPSPARRCCPACTLPNSASSTHCISCQASLSSVTR